jgi:hypothetical protein
MPGLIRGVARTAVIAGTATHVSNNVSRRQSQKWADQDAQQQAPAAPAPEADPLAQIKELAALRDSGALTEEEFAAQKAKLLG